MKKLFFVLFLINFFSLNAMLTTQKFVERKMKSIRSFVQDIKPSMLEHEYFIKEVQAHLSKDKTLVQCTKNNVFAGLGSYDNKLNQLKITIGCWVNENGFHWDITSFSSKRLKTIPSIKALKIDANFKNILIVLANENNEEVEFDLNTFEQKYGQDEN